MKMFALGLVVVAAGVGFYYYNSPYQNCIRAKSLADTVRTGGYDAEETAQLCAEETRW